MATRYDQFGKQMLRAGLESRGTFTPEHEVSPEPQYADGYFVPNLQLASPVAATMLGRITETPTSFEMFSTCLDALEAEGCLRKHFNLRHILRKSVDDSRLPRQWLMSTGKPVSALEKTWGRPATNWPTGVYDLPPVHATSIVVLSELPEERSTLFLRLMARGRTLQRALQELKALSDDEFEKCIALPLLVRYRLEVATAPVSPADEEFLMNTQETYEMFVQRIKLDGKRDGKLEGMRETVLRLLRRKFGALPDDVVTRVQNADTALLEMLEDKVLFANTLDDMFTA